MLHRNLSSPSRLFTLLSLLMIALMVTGTGITLSGFLHQAIIERESLIIRDYVQALAAQENDIEPARRFAPLTRLADAVRLKLYDKSGEVVWSDDTRFIGTQAKRNREFQAAAAGDIGVVFYTEKELPGEAGDPNAMPVVEFYMPIRIARVGAPPIDAVLALYRSARPLNFQIRRAIVLQWLVITLGGVLLYVALFALFRSVLRRQQRAESALSRLSSEHEQIVQMEKLSAVGQLVGEIAHQINDPLVGVMNLAQLAEREADDPVRTREILCEIQQAGSHCRGFVQRMLEFNRLSHFERQPVDLRQLVEGTVALFRQSTPGNPQVRLELPETAPVTADPVLLRHALFNLLTNARHAGGAEAPIHVQLDEREKYWSLSVSDQGPGIDEAHREQLFTPFFTTREGGVGLGLSVVRHILALHGGTVEVHNLAGGGACFTLDIPGETEPANA
ncbi:sensor histidine kinase [Sedimenticola hydrogenitrophicus]|uniref:sensor histidine kinase n=1 Tax=Sedimenticola hydrogenitrophicus TaxID=2967975 RepID=UPI0023AF70F2|nr:HAMP domain-containing sensor histidine kinase [Sedimenticola hydrogenitrophicus]